MTWLLSWLLPAHERLVADAVRRERRALVAHLWAYASGCDAAGMPLEASLLRGLADEVAAGRHLTGGT